MSALPGEKMQQIICTDFCAGEAGVNTCSIVIPSTGKSAGFLTENFITKEAVLWNSGFIRNIRLPAISLRR